MAPSPRGTERSSRSAPASFDAPGLRRSPGAFSSCDAEVLAWDVLDKGSLGRVRVPEAAAYDVRGNPAGVGELVDVARPLEPVEQKVDGYERATNTVPEGMVVVDEVTHAQLVVDARAGREAREHQLAAERKAAVRAAVTDGCIPPARAEHWDQMLAADPGSLEVLNSLKPSIAVNTAETARGAP